MAERPEKGGIPMSKRIKTRMTELLGIEIPVMQSGMQNLAVPELAAAVSNAGGLGTINAATYPDIQSFRAAICLLKELTDKPFCVNVSMLPFVSVGELTMDYMKTLIEEGVTIVETAGRNPKPYVSMLKAAGIRLIHKVPTVKHALKAQSVGADMVSIVGLEGAGHPGADEVTTMILADKASKILDIPVLAGGGIADGRGLAAALALGAEGVFMGTRFAACEECIIHPNYKDWMIRGQEQDTVLIQRSINNMVRVMNNEAARKTAQMEVAGASLEELLPVISGKKGKDAQMSGDLQGGLFSVGEAVGLIDEILPAGELVTMIAAEAIRQMEKLAGQIEEG